MKNLISLFAILLIAFTTNAQTSTVSPTPSALNGSTSGTFGYAEVYKAVAYPAPLCYGGLPAFDNNCTSYTQVWDNTVYVKSAKVSGASWSIPFNSPTYNGFGINLFTTASVDSLLIIYYESNGNWMNTQKLTYTSPSPAFAFPSCPNKPPVANLWYYSDSGQMVAFASNEKNNCPLVATITKNGTTVTATNVKTLCGANAILLVQPMNTMIFNVTEGGTYVATVINAGGNDSSDPVTVPGAPAAPKKGKK